MATNSDLPRALALVQQEHQEIAALFDAFDSAEGERRREIMDEALIRLDIHAQLKDELLYPALEEGGDEDALSEIADGHEELEEMLDDLVDVEEDEEPDEEAFVAFGRRAREIFTQEDQALTRASENIEADLDALGEEMVKRREELQHEIAASGDIEQD